MSMLTFSTLAPQSSDLLAREKHRSWKPLPGSANQTQQTSRSMVNYSTTAVRNYSLPVRLRRLGYVPQYDSLFPHLSVQRNLLYGSNGKPKDHTLEFHHIIDFLEIGHLLDRHVRSLSRGENQRVVIARALLSAPQLLLLDEPLTSLDAKLKNAILQQLQTLHREFGVPMLFVTHDAAEAIAICEEVLLLQAGRITGRGDPAKLLG